MAELRFDITGNTSGAQRSTRDLAGSMDVAARGARLLAESLDKQKRAAAASAGATIAAAKADKILADASDEAIASFAAEKVALDKDRKAKEENALASAALAKSTKGAAAGASALVSPMGALVGAGVALAPVIATVGTGLAGLGIAAVGIVSPILKAAQSTGGLKANLDKLDPAQRTAAQSLLRLQKTYDAFQKSLEPVLFRDFNAAIAAVGPILAGIQPVAKATGNALAFMFKQLGATFQSAEFKQFFQFMATTAGPDVRQLTMLIVDLTKVLPPLLENLQPVATALLAVADGAAKAAKGYLDFIQAQAHKADQPGTLGKQIRDLAHDLLRTSVNADQLKASQEALNRRFADGRIAAADLVHPIGTVIGGLQSAKVATDNERAAVTQLTNALKGLGTGLLTTEQDQVSWRQAQQAATQAIKANTGSLDSNRAAALTARAAIIQSTQAALTFAQQEVNVHHNTDAASAIIRQQIRYLQQHAGQSKIAAREVDALRAALAQLHSKKITITESGIGHFSISNQQSGGRSRVSSATPGRGGAAAGLFIDRGTTPTADDVLVRASKGELIVPTKMVSAGLVDHLRGSIPGFAAGGVAGLAGQTTAFGSRFESRFTAAMEAAMTSAMRAAISVARAAAVGALGGPTSASAAQAQAYARSRLGAYGWGAGQMGPLIALWTQESGWNRYARNPSSGAYGIPQALPPGKMGAAANPPTSSAAAQINWGLGYIAGRYGSPAAAEQHERAFNWYDRGGWLPPGLSLAYNGTGRPEMVTPAGRGGGGGQKIVLQFQPGAEGTLTRALVDVLTRHVRDAGGGDVQVALGTAY